MIELIFILIGIGITVIVLKLPSYTPEQVGSKKMMVRRVPLESHRIRILARKRDQQVKRVLRARTIRPNNKAPEG